MRLSTLRTLDKIIDHIGEGRLLKALNVGLEAGKRDEWTEEEVIKFCRAQVELIKLSKGE